MSANPINLALVVSTFNQQIEHVLSRQGRQELVGTEGIVQAVTDCINICADYLHTTAYAAISIAFDARAIREHLDAAPEAGRIAGQE